MLNFVKSNKLDKFWAIEWFEDYRGGSIHYPTQPLTIFDFNAFEKEVWPFTRKHFESSKSRKIDPKTNVLPDKKELRRALENDIAGILHVYGEGGYILQRAYYPRPNILAMEREQPRFHLKTLDDEKEFMAALKSVLNF